MQKNCWNYDFILGQFPIKAIIWYLVILFISIITSKLCNANLIQLSVQYNFKCNIASKLYHFFQVLSFKLPRKSIQEIVLWFELAIELISLMRGHLRGKQQHVPIKDISKLVIEQTVFPLGLKPITEYLK